MSVNSAIFYFNNERNGVLKVFEHFGLKGEISNAVAINLDYSRVRRIDKKSTDPEKRIA